MTLSSFVSRSHSIRVLVLGAFIAAAVLATGAFGVRDADADSSNAGVFLLRNKATSFYLDSNADRDVYAHAYNGGAYQKWVFVSSGDGYYFLRDDATGFYLDSNADRDVYTHGYNGGSYQQWRLTRNSEGYYTLRNKATGFMLDSNANRDVYTHSSNGGSYQQWRLIATES